MSVFSMVEFFKNRAKWEFDIFEREMLSQSKENIFAFADVIMLKKKIFQVLENENFSQEEMQLLLSYNNMLDFLYMKLSSKKWDSDLLVKEIHRQVSDKTV